MKAINITPVIKRLNSLMSDCAKLKEFLKRCKAGIEELNPTEAKQTTAMAKVAAMVSNIESAFDETKTAFLNDDPIVDPKDGI